MNALVPVAVVLPCYRVSGSICGVIARIGPEVAHIIVVDDACPENSGALVAATCLDPRVTVLTRPVNGGVGAACCDGFERALALGAAVIVKLDGDGQMPPELIPNLISAIIDRQADVVKGNRFHRLGNTRQMPKVRLIGNAALSFLSKISTGYWQLFDPTNGFIAVHASVYAQIASAKLAPRYFFESDLLFQLSSIRARVRELPMQAHYGDEQSNLRPIAMVLPFAIGHLRNFAQRILYQYFVYGFSLASVQLVLGLSLLIGGTGFGASQWWFSVQSGATASAGTVMLAALPIIIGVELLLSWLNFDIQSEPRDVLWPLLVSKPEVL